MRLLRCFDCHTLEQLPDAPSGLDPTHLQDGDDPRLDYVVGKHEDASGRKHHGQLFQVADADWNDEARQKEILVQMGMKSTGLPNEFYEVKDNLKEDALKCFDQHNRPEGYCIDWCSDRKKLGRPTKEGQAWARLNEKAPAAYLCEHCVVASTVMRAVNERNLN